LYQCKMAILSLAPWHQHMDTWIGTIVPLNHKGCPHDHIFEQLNISRLLKVSVFPLMPLCLHPNTPPNP
jgi:hypothetical protein